MQLHRSKHKHVYVNVRRWYVWEKKRKKEKTADIVICTDARVLTRVCKHGKRGFEFNDDEYVDVDLLCVDMGMWVVWE